jgi:hypothetical protein
MSDSHGAVSLSLLFESMTGLPPPSGTGTPAGTGYPPLSSPPPPLPVGFPFSPPEIDAAIQAAVGVQVWSYVIESVLYGIFLVLWFYTVSILLDRRRKAIGQRLNYFILGCAFILFGTVTAVRPPRTRPSPLLLIDAPSAALGYGRAPAAPDLRARA